MLRRYPQNLPHVTVLGVPGSHTIGPVRESDRSIQGDVPDHFRLSREAMDMARLMILGIGYEQHFAEAK